MTLPKAWGHCAVKLFVLASIQCPLYLLHGERRPRAGHFSGAVFFVYTFCVCVCMRSWESSAASWARLISQRAASKSLGVVTVVPEPKLGWSDEVSLWPGPSHCRVLFIPLCHFSQYNQYIHSFFLFFLPPDKLGPCWINCVCVTRAGQGLQWKVFILQCFQRFACSLQMGDFQACGQCW